MFRDSSSGFTRITGDCRDTLLRITPDYDDALLTITALSPPAAVQELRLEKAFALLNGKTRAARKILEAAYDAGVIDLAFQPPFLAQVRTDADGRARTQPASAFAGPRERVSAPAAVF